MIEKYGALKFIELEEVKPVEGIDRTIYLGDYIIKNFLFEKGYFMPEEYKDSKSHEKHFSNESYKYIRISPNRVDELNKTLKERENKKQIIDSTTLNGFCQDQQTSSGKLFRYQIDKSNHFINYDILTGIALDITEEIKISYINKIGEDGSCDICDIINHLDMYLAEGLQDRYELPIVNLTGVSLNQFNDYLKLIGKEIEKTTIKLYLYPYQKTV